MQVQFAALGKIRGRVSFGNVRLEDDKCTWRCKWGKVRGSDVLRKFGGWVGYFFGKSIYISAQKLLRKNCPKRS